ncbi:MAG: alpha/beta hydrolase [Porphyrobacter sp.]|nr:alpha/beta hydrolase [Porphyrobacter sp.]
MTIVAHSYGGAIALLYAAIYPERVRRLVAIEAMLPPAAPGAPESRPAPQIWRDWIEERRAIAIRPPRRYASVEDALARMQAANAHLSEAQARHLTLHGVNRNEDGTFSWKFDDLFRAGSPQNLTEAEQHRLWEAVTCPVLLAHGEESWATDPADDGRLAHFADARVVRFAGAGHWVHHDRLEAFVAELRAFL